MAPPEIASEIQAAIELADGVLRRRLTEALDALSDGLPADDVATILRSTLDQLEGGSGT